MELKSLTSYKSAFALIRFILLVVIVSAFSAVVAVYYMFEKKVEELSSNIYIIDEKGNTMSASQSEQTLQTRIFEYEDHIKDFYSLWYSFDEGSYKRNIEAALYLAGETGKELLNVYEEEDVFNKVKEKNLKLFVNIESVVINVNTIPISGTIKGTQTIKRLQGELTRHLDCTFTLHDVDRSKNNSHGVKIENWKIINNNKIEDGTE